MYREVRAAEGMNVRASRFEAIAEMAKSGADPKNRLDCVLIYPCSLNKTHGSIVSYGGIDGVRDYLTLRLSSPCVVCTLRMASL